MMVRWCGVHAAGEHAQPQGIYLAGMTIKGSIVLTMPARSSARAKRNGSLEVWLEVWPANSQRITSDRSLNAMEEKSKGSTASSAESVARGDFRRFKFEIL